MFLKFLWYFVFHFFSETGNNSRIINLGGRSQPVGSHDAIYASWTEISKNEIEKPEVQKSSVNLLTEDSDEESEEKIEKTDLSVKPKKRLALILKKISMS